MAHVKVFRLTYARIQQNMSISWAIRLQTIFIKTTTHWWFNYRHPTAGKSWNWLKAITFDIKKQWKLVLLQVEGGLTDPFSNNFYNPSSNDSGGSWGSGNIHGLSYTSQYPNSETFNKIFKSHDRMESTFWISMVIFIKPETFQTLIQKSTNWSYPDFVKNYIDVSNTKPLTILFIKSLYFNMKMHKWIFSHGLMLNE